MFAVDPDNLANTGTEAQQHQVAESPSKILSSNRQDMRSCKASKRHIETTMLSKSINNTGKKSKELQAVTLTGEMYNSS